MICCREESFEVYIKLSNFSSQGFFRSCETKPVRRKPKDPVRIWVVSFEFSAMSNQEGWRKIGNISLKSCSQMLKEIGRIENLVRTDKMCEIAGASPIHM